MQYIVNDFIVDANAIRTVNVRIDLVPVQAVPLYRDKMTLAGGAKVHFVRLPYKMTCDMSSCHQVAKRMFTVQNAFYHPNSKMYLGQSQTEIFACPTQVKAFV